MKSRLQDPLTEYIQLHADIPDIIGSIFPDRLDTSTNVMCPWHNDKTPSLHIYEDGGGKCFGCGKILRDIVDLYAQVNGITYNQAQRILYADLIDAISDSQVAQFHKLLRGKPLDWLLTERNITPKTIAQRQIGYNPQDNRVIIPIRDQFGFVRNLRRIAWTEGSTVKVCNDNGHGSVRPYPETNLVLSRRILLVEGELDCLVARQYGLPAVTWTGGADSWGEEHLPLFRGKYVWILYDNDEAGIRGAKKQAAMLQHYAAHVGIVVPLSRSGKDVTDWSFVCPNELTALADRIKSVKIVESTPKPKICPTCGQEVRQ